MRDLVIMASVVGVAKTVQARSANVGWVAELRVVVGIECAFGGLEEASFVLVFFCQNLDGFLLKASSMRRRLIADY